MQFNILSRMRLWQKFAVIGVLALAAVAVPYAQFFSYRAGGDRFRGK